MPNKKTQNPGELKLSKPPLPDQSKDAAPIQSSKELKTRVIVKYDVGYANDLYLRGKGAELSWEKGVKLKNTKPDEWVWETNVPFSNCEFKVLINDQVYETGENHPLHCGSCISYSPHFQ